MAEIEVKDLTRRMDGAIEALKREFAGLRTGRASASLLEPIHVNAYGSEMPLNQVATISVPEPRLISVQVWDRGLASAVDKAIRDAGLGLNPRTEGQLVRVPIPELSSGAPARVDQGRTQICRASAGCRAQRAAGRYGHAQAQGEGARDLRRRASRLG